MIHVCAAHRGLCVRTSQTVHTAQHERWLLWHSGSGLLAAVIGVTGLAFEARIVAGWCTHAICSGDGRTLARSLASAITEDCCGLISFGIAGGLSPDLPAALVLWDQRSCPRRSSSPELVASVTSTHPQCDSWRDCRRDNYRGASRRKALAAYEYGRARGRQRIPRGGERRCSARSPYGRGPCHHGSSHPPDPCCRFGFGACKRDDRSRRTSPCGNETA